MIEKPVHLSGCKPPYQETGTYRSGKEEKTPWILAQSHLAPISAQESCIEPQGALGPPLKILTDRNLRRILEKTDSRETRGEMIRFVWIAEFWFGLQFFGGASVEQRCDRPSAVKKPRTYICRRLHVSGLPCTGNQIRAVRKRTRTREIRYSTFSWNHGGCTPVKPRSPSFLRANKEVQPHGQGMDPLRSSAETSIINRPWDHGDPRFRRVCLRDVASQIGVFRQFSFKGKPAQPLLELGQELLGRSQFFGLEPDLLPEFLKLVGIERFVCRDAQ